MSGTIAGARTGAYGPRIIIEWKVLEQDIAGNRSKVEAISYMDVAGTISYTSRNNVNINIAGNSVNKTAKSSGSGAWKRELNRHTAWVTHSSDGTKNITISSSYNVQITWRGQWIGNISAGATVTLDSIPRASTINSASFPYYLQAPKGVASANSISISLSKKLSSYTHYIKLAHGNTFIGEWNESNPTSLTLNTTHITRIFNALPNSTSGTFRLTVVTKSGSATIGSASTNITARLHSNSGPYFNSNTIGIAGSGKDKSWGTYIQSISKASLTSSASAGLGATLRSISITQGSSVVGSSTGANVSATSPTLTASGNVSFKFKVTDSRGNNTEETKTINVLPYVTPSVNTFSAQRNATTSTTANISYNVSYSPVNGNNKLTIVSKYTGSATGTPVNKTFSGTGTARATDSSSYSITNLNKFGNFDFSIEITDSLGNKSSNVYSMTSSALPLSLDKNNQGIGVGKDYERGALDVGGDAYIDGKLYVDNKEIQSTAGSDSLGDLNAINNVANGVTFQHISALAKNNPGQAWGFLIDIMGGGTSDNAQFFLQRDGTQKMFTRAKTNGAWKGWNKVAYDSDVMPTRGSNSNGEWVRFPDGTQICWKWRFGPNGEKTNLKSGGGTNQGTGWRSGSIKWSFPAEFDVDEVSAFATSRTWYNWVTGNGVTNSSADFIQWAVADGNATAMDVMAIGRWK